MDLLNHASELINSSMRVAFDNLQSLSNQILHEAVRKNEADGVSYLTDFLRNDRCICTPFLDIKLSDDIIGILDIILKMSLESFNILYENGKIFYELGLKFITVALNLAMQHSGFCFKMVSLECARQAIDMAKREAIHQLEETTNNALNEMERVGTDALHKLNEIRRNNPKCSECPAEAVEISDEAISILDSILQVTIVSLNVICGYTCKESRHIFDLGLKYMGPASEVIERCFDDLAKLLQKYIKELTKALDKFEHAVKKDLYHSGKYAKKKSNQFKKFVKAVKKKSSHIFRKSSSNLNTKSSHTMDASSVHLDQVLISALKSSHILSDKSTKEVVNRTSSVVNITTPDDSDKK